MHAERWRRLQEIFEAVRGLPVHERRTFLDSNCAGDSEMRAEVETLIAADAKGADWLSRVVGEAAAAITGPEASSWTAGLRIGPYEIVRELSRGGMGIVFLAERADQQFRMRVAIKVVRATLASPDLL